jgi:hypothetical protein
MCIPTSSKIGCRLAFAEEISSHIFPQLQKRSIFAGNQGFQLRFHGTNSRLRGTKTGFLHVHVQKLGEIVGKSGKHWFYLAGQKS